MRITRLIPYLLLLLAAAPWIVKGCARPPLLPPALEEERSQYEASVELAQNATMEAQRQGESQRNVVTLGTVAPTPDQPGATSGSITAELPLSITATATGVVSSPLATAPALFATPTAQLQLRTTAEPGSSSANVVRSATLTPTQATPAEAISTGTLSTTHPATGTATAVLATRVIIVGRSGTPHAPEAGPVDGGMPVDVPARPSGLVETEDVITQEMLTEQLAQEASDASVIDLRITLTPDGFRASGRIIVNPTFVRPVEMWGTFAVENDSLVTQVASILFNGMGVTAEHRSQVEERMDWGLYQLLPQRYVDSFQVEVGRIVVQSQVRP